MTAREELLAKALEQARCALVTLDHPNGVDSGLDLIRGGRSMEEIISEALRAPAQYALRRLDWQETFTDRGDGSKDQTGWEADSGFGSWYSVEQYFGSDSYGWETKFDCEVISDHDDPEQAKKAAQDDFERRASSLTSTLNNVRAEAFEKAAKIAENNGWEATAAQIRDLSAVTPADGGGK